MVTNVIATCENCDFKRIANYDYALSESRKHIKEKTKHTVRIVRTLTKFISVK